MVSVSTWKPCMRNQRMLSVKDKQVLWFLWVCTVYYDHRVMARFHLCNEGSQVKQSALVCSFVERGSVWPGVWDKEKDQECLGSRKTTQITPRHNWASSISFVMLRLTHSNTFTPFVPGSSQPLTPNLLDKVDSCSWLQIPSIFEWKVVTA